MKNTILTIFVLIFSAYTQAQKGSSLIVGDQAPKFSSLQTSDKKFFSSIDKLKEGSLIVVFFRGSWCPYCEAYIDSLRMSYNKMVDEGANLVLITPEQPKYSFILTESKAIKFPIIFDEDYSIMKAFGVDFALNNTAYNNYKRTLRDIDEANGNEERILPIPATFVINKNGTINYIHFDKNYKKRPSINEIMSHL